MGERYNPRGGVPAGTNLIFCVDCCDVRKDIYIYIQRQKPLLTIVCSLSVYVVELENRKKMVSVGS